MTGELTLHFLDGAPVTLREDRIEARHPTQDDGSGTTLIMASGMLAEVREEPLVVEQLILEARWGVTGSA